ncbi:MAG: hypothetical protein K8R77_15375 [Anaerolineaceae bacterium]|nr:hypothetical protein [Anaerolineaceae bacterium]
MSNGIIRRTAWLCLTLILLASCAPLTEGQALANNEDQSPPAAAQPQIAAGEATEPRNEPLPTPEPMPTLPVDFDPAAFLSAGPLDVKALPDEEGAVRSGEGTLVIIYPLLKDDETGEYHYDTAHEITILRLPAGILLGTGEQYVLRSKASEENSAVQEVQAAVLPHLVGGQPFLGLAVLSAGVRDLTSGAYLPEQIYVEKAETGILAEATYFGGRDTIYPNKLENILIAVSYMTEYQGDNGAFQARDGYSFNNLIRLRGGDTLRYADGANNLWAAGVCAVASLTSATLYELSQTLGVDYTNSLSSIIRTQYQHKIAAPYASCPYIPVEVDTVVAVLPDLSADLVWQMPPEPAETYLSFDAAVIANDVPFEDTAEDGIDGISDAELLVTMAFTSSDPGPQSGTIQSLLSAYRLFRSSQHENVQGRLIQGEAVYHVKWDTGNWYEIAHAILPLD